jgi:hypothetical protein
MSATLQINVDYDDLTAQELLEDLTPAINHWLWLAGSHYGEALESAAADSSHYSDAAPAEWLRYFDDLPAYRAAEILTTKHIIKDEPVLMLISYAVPPGTEEGKATCYIGPAKKVRDKAAVLARTYKIEEGRVE